VSGPYVVLEAAMVLPGGMKGAGSGGASCLKLTRAQCLTGAARAAPGPGGSPFAIERLLLLRQRQPLPAGA